MESENDVIIQNSTFKYNRNKSTPSAHGGVIYSKDTQLTLSEVEAIGNYYCNFQFNT